MKKEISFVLLFSVGYVNCMSGEKHSKHSSVLRKSNTSPRKMRTRKRTSLDRLRHSFSKKHKELSSIAKLRKDIQKDALTEKDIQAIRFLLDEYEQAKKKVVQETKQSGLSLSLSSLEDIDKEDKDGKTKLYHTIEQANEEIQKMGILPEHLESKLSYLLISSANPNKICHTGKSPRSIASPKVKQVIDEWMEPGYSPRKREMCDIGVKYPEYYYKNQQEKKEKKVNY